jgi:hypothetical protein
VDQDIRFLKREQVPDSLEFHPPHLAQANVLGSCGGFQELGHQSRFQR